MTYTPKSLSISDSSSISSQTSMDSIHVHVKHGSEECIFDIILEDAKLLRLDRRKKQGAEPMNAKDSAEAVAFINEYWQQIVEKWVLFHVYHQVVKNTKINKRIRGKKGNENA